MSSIYSNFKLGGSNLAISDELVGVTVPELLDRLFMRSLGDFDESVLLLSCERERVFFLRFASAQGSYSSSSNSRKVFLMVHDIPKPDATCVNRVRTASSEAEVSLHSSASRSLFRALTGVAWPVRAMCNYSRSKWVSLTQWAVPSGLKPLESLRT